MKNTELFQGIASEIQIFQNIEQKESFLFVLGALAARVISLKKAAEVMEIEPEVFVKLLDLIGFEFSYLSQEDVLIERDW
jgi:hypothetical protein